MEVGERCGEQKSFEYCSRIPPEGLPPNVGSPVQSGSVLTFVQTFCPFLRPKVKRVEEKV